MTDPLPNIPHQPPRTEQEQEASFEKHGDNHYLRFIHMSAFAARLEAESWVPGIMHCAVCNFSLQRITLFVKSGTAGAGNHEPEDCPNGCGPMAPMTWKMRAEQNSDLLEQQFERIQGLEAALKRLRAWDGVGGGNYSGTICIALHDWIDAGMQGPPPAIPEHLAGLKGKS